MSFRLVGFADRTQLLEDARRKLEDGCRVKRRGISSFGEARVISGFSHKLDFFQLRFLKTEVSRHLNYLGRIDEVSRVGTKLLYARIKAAAAHGLGDVKAKQAFAILTVVHTKFANDHLGS